MKPSKTSIWKDKDMIIAFLVGVVIGFVVMFIL